MPACGAVVLKRTSDGGKIGHQDGKPARSPIQASRINCILATPAISGRTILWSMCPDMLDEPLSRQYMRAFYASILLLGGGDTYPTTPGHELFSAVVMLIGIFTNSVCPLRACGNQQAIKDLLDVCQPLLLSCARAGYCAMLRLDSFIFSCNSLSCETGRDVIIVRPLRCNQVIIGSCASLLASMGRQADAEQEHFDRLNSSLSYHKVRLHSAVEA